MPIKVLNDDGKETYKCSICGKNWGTNVLMAVSCEKTHDVVYIKASPQEVKLLLQYIYLSEGNKDILPENLMRELAKIARKF